MTAAASTGPVRRPGRPSEGAREALLAAARELFAARDFEDVSTGAVLAHAGVSRGAMYHHFQSKTELFRAAWEASERDLMARLAARVEGDAAHVLGLVPEIFVVARGGLLRRERAREHEKKAGENEEAGRS